MIYQKIKFYFKNILIFNMLPYSSNCNNGNRINRRRSFTLIILIFLIITNYNFKANLFQVRYRLPEAF